MSSLDKVKVEDLFQVCLERGISNPDPVDSHFPRLGQVSDRVKGGLAKS